MISVILRCGRIATLPEGAAVAPTVFPHAEGETPGKALDVLDANGRQLARFRIKEVSGYAIGATISEAWALPEHQGGAGAEQPPA